MPSVATPSVRFARVRAIAVGASALALANAAPAQVSAGVNLGGSTYLGDLAPSSPLDHAAGLGASFGAFARFPLAAGLRLRTFVQRSHVRGHDAERPNTRERNLSFASAITEAGVALEAGWTWAGIRPYGFAGVSAYRFNPTTEYRGATVELQSLGTEGQGSPGYDAPYALTRVAVPFGSGLEVAVGERLTLGVEVSARATFFDHLDDVSGAYAPDGALDGPEAVLRRALADRRGEGTGEPLPPNAGTPRGDPDDNDWYALAVVTLALTLPTPEREERVEEPPCYRF